MHKNKYNSNRNNRSNSNSFSSVPGFFFLLSIKEILFLKILTCFDNKMLNKEIGYVGNCVMTDEAALCGEQS